MLDLSGKLFGKLRVAREDVDTEGPRRWICQCACGVIVSVAQGNLRAGKSTTCGCSRVKHGQWKTKTYAAWRSMRQRCMNPQHQAYRNYGARGITVCRRWGRFAAFLADMGACPPTGTLERKNNAKGYSPSNCVWASAKEQGRNRRTNKLTRADVFAILASDEWQWVLADKYGVSQPTISRVKRGECWA